LAIGTNIADKEVVGTASAHTDVVLKVKAVGVVAGKAVVGRIGTGKAVAVTSIADEGDDIGNVIIDGAGRLTGAVKKIVVWHTRKTIGGSPVASRTRLRAGSTDLVESIGEIPILTVRHA
jgi:hypothetical protein